MESLLKTKKEIQQNRFSGKRGTMLRLSLTLDRRIQNLERSSEVSAGAGSQTKCMMNSDFVSDNNKLIVKFVWLDTIFCQTNLISVRHVWRYSHWLWCNIKNCWKRQKANWYKSMHWIPNSPCKIQKLFRATSLKVTKYLSIPQRVRKEARFAISGLSYCDGNNVQNTIKWTPF